MNRTTLSRVYDPLAPASVGHSGDEGLTSSHDLPSSVGVPDSGASSQTTTPPAIPAALFTEFDGTTLRRVFGTTPPPSEATPALDPSVLAVTQCGFAFANPFMNAAGVLCSTAADLAAMEASIAGAAVTKSCTLEPRQGNPEPRYVALPLGSINSMGLPNLGFDFYASHVAARAAKATPLFFSMCGLSLEDNVAMAARLAPLAAEGRAILELNLSCPNVPGKPQVGYDLASMEENLRRVSEVFSSPFGVKLPPYFDIAHFDQAAEVLNRFPNVTFLTCVNSIGNGLVIDVETEGVVIRPKQGFGGIGGQYILPTALANVNAFYRRCPQKQVNGCGGIVGGKEAFMHVLAGATMLQVGTQLHEEGPGAFVRIQAELLAIMQRKGYATLDDFRGKVKTMD